MNFEKVSKISIKDDDISGPNAEEYTRNRLFVSNFPFSWKESDLKEFFVEYGPVDDVEIVYNDRGSKGFGFVTINDGESCMRARTNLNQKIVQGRCVEVRFANRNKRATNTGPPGQNKGNDRQAVESVAHQIKKLNTMLMTATQFHQQVALQAALAQPMLALFQNQFAASAALANNYQLGLSSSCAALPTLHGNNGPRVSLGFTGSHHGFAQPPPSENPQRAQVDFDGSQYPTFSGFDAPKTPNSVSGVDAFPHNFWHYDGPEALAMESPRNYNLFGRSSTMDLPSSMDHVKQSVTSNQQLDVDEEGNIEFRPVPVGWSTPMRPYGALDRSFSTPNVSKLGH